MVSGNATTSFMNFGKCVSLSKGTTLMETLCKYMKDYLFLCNKLFEAICIANTYVLGLLLSEYRVVIPLMHL